MASSPGSGDPGLPPLSRAQRILLPVADAFMVAMLSRPPSGSLRTTRVTTASIGLASAGFLVFGVLGVVLALASPIEAVVTRVVRSDPDGGRESIATMNASATGSRIR